ncbi:MAG: Glutamyl-tRNA(Gln) amidotransferase subunit A [Candidatus Izimaplasma bacterium HR2]|nr:MAG: Glutamyl-tRNA(Gln) amidotransferase subunit A [Candidatus Izimaplasma bacterium HR2]
MFDVVEKNILELQEALNSGIITSRDLVLIYMDRIVNIDNGKINYNSVLEVNPDALNIASVLDKERLIGKVRGLMHGIPVILKDNINTMDKMHTTAGSLALKDNYANYDATIASKLRDNGAIILGKANLTEFANFMSYNMRNGYSSLGKEVLCPFNLDIDPSGSSAGSAVSVSLNLTPVSIGTETGGSIMSPAAQNGVVGIKPTLGFVSRKGIVPISSTLDTAGPMAKNVTDAAILLSAIRSNDINDPITNEKTDEFIDYTKFLDKDALQGARIGIDKARYDKLSEAKKKVFNNNVKVMEDAGAIIVKDLNIKQTEYIFYVMKYEFKRNINNYLSSLGNNTKIKTLKEIVEFNRNNDIVCLKYGQKLLEECEYNTSGRMNEEEYLKGIKEREDTIKVIDKIFDKNNLDLIYFANYTSLGPHCGYPTMTIPSGKETNNIPIGTYFLAPKYKEENLIKIGYALEQIIKKRVNPLQ